MVLEDVREGLVSVESARRDYGVVIEEVNGELKIVKDIRDEMDPPETGPSPRKRPLEISNRPPAQLTGHWQTRSPRLYETETLTCDVCGKVIPADYWAVDEGGQTYRFCDPKCERLDRDYWRLRYGDRT